MKCNHETIVPGASAGGFEALKSYLRRRSKPNGAAAKSE